MTEENISSIPPVPETILPPEAETVPPAPPEVITPPPLPAEPIAPTPSLKSFLAKALEKIQFRKKAKLEKIVKLAREKKSITNDQVEKLLHISDATATRYLSALVKQGRLRRIGFPQKPTV